MNPFRITELSGEVVPQHLLEISHDCPIFAAQSIDQRSAAAASLRSLLEMLNLRPQPEPAESESAFCKMLG